MLVVPYAIMICADLSKRGREQADMRDFLVWRDFVRMPKGFQTGLLKLPAGNERGHDLKRPPR